MVQKKALCEVFILTLDNSLEGHIDVEHNVVIKGKEYAFNFIVTDYGADKHFARYSLVIRESGDIDYLSAIHRDGEHYDNMNVTKYTDEQMKDLAYNLADELISKYIR